MFPRCSRAVGSPPGTATTRFVLFERIFGGVEPPAVSRTVENIDVSTLDTNHGPAPNMGVLCNRGIWFPLGYG